MQKHHSKTLVSFILILFLSITLPGCRSIAPESSDPPSQLESTSPSQDPTYDNDSTDPSSDSPSPTQSSTTPTQDTTPSQGTDPTQDTTPSQATGPSQTTTPSQNTTPTTAPSEGPLDPTEPSTQPTDPTTKPTSPPINSEPPDQSETTPQKTLTYLEYKNLSASQQLDYYYSFSNPADFFSWYNSAKNEYESQQENLPDGTGSVDLDDVINGNS